MAHLEDMLVEDVMRRWPATMRVYLDHRMHCIGCPVSCLHTVTDACREHAVDQKVFEADLRAAIATRPEELLAGNSDGQMAAH